MKGTGAFRKLGTKKIKTRILEICEHPKLPIRVFYILERGHGLEHKHFGNYSKRPVLGCIQITLRSDYARLVHSEFTSL